MAILRACRQMNREAYYNFYASNSFRLPCVKDLHDFLVSLGSARRDVLRSLYIEDLFTPESRFTKVSLDQMRAVGFSLVGYRYAGHYAREAARFLGRCNSLCKIHFDMGEDSPLCYVLWLSLVSGYNNAQIDFVDESH